MKKILSFFLLPSLLFCQTTDWVKSFGGTESDKGISIGTDSLGNVYIADIIIHQQILIRLHLQIIMLQELIKKILLQN